MQRGRTYGIKYSEDGLGISKGGCGGKGEVDPEEDYFFSKPKTGAARDGEWNSGNRRECSKYGQGRLTKSWQTREEGARMEGDQMIAFSLLRQRKRIERRRLFGFTVQKRSSVRKVPGKGGEDKNAGEVLKGGRGSAQKQKKVSNFTGERRPQPS